MDEVIGSASIVIRPEMGRFGAEVEAKSAAGLTGFQKKAEKAGEDGGAKLSKGFKSGLGGVESALSSLGVPLNTFGGRLNNTAASIAKVDAGGSKLGSTMATLGGRTLIGAAAGFAAVGAAGIDLAIKQERVTASIAATANIAPKAAKAITDSFLSTAGTAEFSGRAIGEAYAPVSGVLGAVAGHALDAGEATKFMSSTMDLAVATGGHLVPTTEAVAKVMQAYHLQVTEAGKASDILFSASRETGVGVESLGTVLGRVKGKLGDLAPSLAESAGLITTLAKNGAVGRVAVSALSTSLTTLTGGGKKTEEMAKKLGVEIFDSNGKFVGLKSVLEQVQKPLGELSPKYQKMATEALFGKAATSQLLDVIKAGPAAYEASAKAVERQGAAHAAAEKQSETLEGELRKLRAAAEDLATRVGQVLLPILTRLAKGLAEGVEWLKHHEAAAKALAVVITTVLGAAIGAFVAQKVAGFISGVQAMLVKLGLLGPATSTAAGEMAVAEGEIVAGAETTAASVDAALLGTGIGATLVLLGIAAYELSEHWEEVMTALEEATAKAANFIIGLLNSVIEGFNETIGELTGGIGKLSEVTVESSGFTGKEERENEAEGTSKEKGRPAPGVTALTASKYGAIAEAAAKKYGIPANVLLADIEQETGGKEETSSTGARGVTQFEPGTAKKYGVKFGTSQADVESQIFGQAHYLKDLGGQHDLKGALEGYYTGKAGSSAGSGYADSVLKKAGADGKHAKAVETDTTALTHHSKALEEAVASSGTKAGKAAKGKTSEYVSPFLGASELHRGREDEGIDFTAKVGSKIGAIGEGFIDKIVANWYKGQSLIEEKLTSGSHKGQYVYYAEQLNAAVREGQKVKAGQTIGTVAAHGTGLELGFGAGGGRTLAQATTGYKEGEKTPAAAEFSKFLATLGKGGSSLSVASKIFEDTAKAELKKQTADQKAGTAELNKMLAAIQSGGVKELDRVVGGSHDKALAELEKTLHGDHSSALEKLRKELVAAHTRALAALNKALIKLAEETAVKKIDKEDKLHTDEATATANRIGDEAKLSIDKAGEAGLAGADLAAAHAQTELDQVKLANDISIALAQQALDNAEGTGALAEAQAKQALTNTENQAKINDAQAQSALDLANQAAKEAQASTQRAEKEKQEAEARERAAHEGGAGSSATGGQMWQLNFYGANPAPGDIMAEVTWLLKTGQLPTATPLPAHAVQPQLPPGGVKVG